LTKKTQTKGKLYRFKRPSSKLLSAFFTHRGTIIPTPLLEQSSHRGTILGTNRKKLKKLREGGEDREAVTGENEASHMQH
jgi:hypothetical protein